MAVTTSLSLSPPPLSSIFKPRLRYFLTAHNPSLSTTQAPASLSLFSARRTIPYLYTHHEISLKTTQIWRISAAAGDVLPSEANPIENSQQIVSINDEGGSTVISVLLFIAFIGLSILTIGVIYLAVTDFLQKRETQKFEKEETTKKKKTGKKGKLRARAGPRGFGQKIDEEEVEDD